MINMQPLSARTRTILFLTVCIGVRIGLALLARSKPKLVAPFIALISVGFFTIYFTGIRKACPESGSMDACWWNDLRPIHGALYALFVILALQDKPYAWYVLLIDVMVGLTAFSMHTKA